MQRSMQFTSRLQSAVLSSTADWLYRYKGAFHNFQQRIFFLQQYFPLLLRKKRK